MANKKVVVAFSGGLDTSYTVMKLTQDGWDISWVPRHTSLSMLPTSITRNH